MSESNDENAKASEFKELLDSVKDENIKADMKTEIKEAKKENMEITDLSDPDLSKSIEYVVRNGNIVKKTTTFEPLESQRNKDVKAQDLKDEIESNR